jgi:hypothetical protein
MAAEERYDRSGDQARLYARMNVGPRGPYNQTTTEHLRSFSGFCDNHPDVAEQLKAQPTMINSQAYISDHPELQAYLQSNPDVAQDLQQNPQTFMSQISQLPTSDLTGKTSTSTDSTGKTSTSTQAPPKLTANPPH